MRHLAYWQSSPCAQALFRALPKSSRLRKARRPSSLGLQAFTGIGGDANPIQFHIAQFHSLREVPCSRQLVPASPTSRVRSCRLGRGPCVWHFDSQPRFGESSTSCFSRLRRAAPQKLVQICTRHCEDTSALRGQTAPGSLNITRNARGPLAAPLTSTL